MELKALLDINKQLLIRRLSNEGLSQREIAKQTGISRTTIRSYISDTERVKVLTRQKSCGVQ
ncbi:helix-turn-helix domain-containing protein [Anaerobiospirillum succiniciproducens]|uniref:helix-turn-helix domain-containing protein n=1 Tax=Anaerobiospirillum succiniciproducens TaxID=13335 RepID=UPI003F8CD973